MSGSGGPVLVLDAGTSALKAALVDAEGRIAAAAEAGYGAEPAPYRQRPEAWWQAACTAVAGLGPVAPRAIALTGTMENLVPVSAQGRAVADAILYADSCGEAWLARHGPALAAADAATVLGNAPEPLMSAFKALWLAEDAPDVLAAARWLLLSPKDFLILRMTGRAVSDPTTATTSGLMALATRRWSAPLLDLLGIEAQRLPALVAADTVVGTLGAAAARSLGLAEGLPVHAGCGDAGAATVGSGCVAPGDVSVHLGTTGWVARVVSDDTLGRPRPCYRLAHPRPGLVIEVLPLLSAGGAAAWARRVFGLEPAAAEQAAREADRDAPDILFLPYLNGERSPFLDLDVRGAFLGLDAAHGPGALYRAVLEGVALALRASLRALCGDSVPSRVGLCGGGARSALWAALIADCLDTPVHVAAEPETVTAVGAAVACGLVRAADIGAGPPVRPRPDRQARTARLARLYDEATAFARASAGLLRGNGA
ncbi:MAG: FGGY family carbohydrate kinase [Alphaproteobacteria bacterium]